jgi:hypothetical protein
MWKLRNTNRITENESQAILFSRFTLACEIFFHHSIRFHRLNSVMMLRRGLCVWQAINVVSAVKWEGAKSTNGATLVTASINPTPTAIEELIKRDAWPASYCGFVGGTSCRCLLHFVEFSWSCHVTSDEMLMTRSSGCYLL